MLSSTKKLQDSLLYACSALLFPDYTKEKQFMKRMLFFFRMLGVYPDMIKRLHIFKDYRSGY